MQNQNQAKKQTYGVIRQQINPDHKIKKMEQNLLDDVNHFFKMLEIDFQWEDYSKYVDYHLDKNKKKYCELLNQGVLISSDEKIYIFYSSAADKPQDFTPHNYPNYHYDDQKYALATLAHEYICIKRNEIDVNRTEQRQIDPFPFSLNSLAKANYFLKALGSDRVFKAQKEMFNWKSWRVYWSTPQRPAFCYSTCSGGCTEYCKGAKCMYIFPASELDYAKLPDVERADDRNVFDDDKYWLAEMFSDFVEEHL